MATLIALALSFSLPAASHSMAYSGGRGPSGVTFDVDCGIGNHVVINLSYGGVCFGALPGEGWGNGNEGFTDELGNPAGSALSQHLTPRGPDSLMFFDLNDASFALIRATYCQDNNEDGLCGGDRAGPPETEPGGNPSAICQGAHIEGIGGCDLRSEPYVTFCDTIWIRAGLTFPSQRRVPGEPPGSSGDGTWSDPLVDNWEVDSSVYIMLSDPSNGNPTTGVACSSLGWSTNLLGVMEHS